MGEQGSRYGADPASFPCLSLTVDPVAALITFAVYVFATARITRLIKDDELLRGFRAAWNRRHAQGTLRRYWITCTWCLSIAAAGLPAAAWVLFPDHPGARIPAAILCLSYLTVVIADVQGWIYGKKVLYTPVEEEANR